MNPELVLVSYDHPDAEALAALVQAYYVVIYGGPDTTPTDPAQFAPPNGAFFVAYLADDPVAMGGWRFHKDEIGADTRKPAEIKRMYVVEHARGRGLARTVLAKIEDSARDAGADMMVLETGARQVDAVGLYLSSGYETIPRFGHYASEPGARHLGKRL